MTEVGNVYTETVVLSDLQESLVMGQWTTFLFSHPLNGDIEEVIFTFSADAVGSSPPLAPGDHGALSGLEDDDHPQYAWRVLQWMKF